MSKKKSRGITENILIGEKKNAFLDFFLDSAIGYRTLSLFSSPWLTLAKKKNRFWSFQIFLVEVHVEYRTRSSKKSFQFIFSDLTTLLRIRRNFKGWKLKNSDKSLDSWATSQPRFSNFGEGCVRFYSRKRLKVTLLSCVGNSPPQKHTIFRLFLQCF